MAIKNSLAKKQTFSTFLTSDAIKQKVLNMIGQKDGPRFISSLISAVTANPALAECEFSSILSAGMLGEALKLTPSPQLGQYFMVPFNDRKRGVKIAQFQLGYKGYIQLAIRSGHYKKLNVLAIKEGELIKFDPLNEEIEVNIIEDDTIRENTTTIGYYAMFEYSNGFRKALYWSKKKMVEHAKNYSQGYMSDIRNKTQYTFWSKDFDSQGLKTMLRQLISKWGIMSIDLQDAIDKDYEPMPEKTDNDDFFNAGVTNEQEQANIPSEKENKVEEAEVVEPKKQRGRPKKEPVGTVSNENNQEEETEEDPFNHEAKDQKASSVETIGQDTAETIKKQMEEIIPTASVRASVLKDISGKTRFDKLTYKEAEKVKLWITNNS